MIWTLEPLLTYTDRHGVKTHEQILIRDERGYPWAVTHIDTFHDPAEASNDPNSLYNRLYRQGETCTIRIVWAEKRQNET